MYQLFQSALQADDLPFPVQQMAESSRIAYTTNGADSSSTIQQSARPPCLDTRTAELAIASHISLDASSEIWMFGRSLRLETQPPSPRTGATATSPRTASRDDESIRNAYLCREMTMKLVWIGCLEGMFGAGLRSRCMNSGYKSDMRTKCDFRLRQGESLALSPSVPPMRRYFSSIPSKSVPSEGSRSRPTEETEHRRI